MDVRNSIRVVMLPWLAHGHISPFLELAKKLASRNFFIYFCSTPVNLTSIEGKLTEENSLSISLVELHLPVLPDLPPHYHTTNGLPPHLMSTLKTAFDMSSPTFAKILKTIKPDLLIYDVLQPWAPLAASSQNIPAVLFLSTGATLLSVMFHLALRPDTELPFPDIPIQNYKNMIMHTNFVDSTANGMTDEERSGQCLKQSDIILIKTFRELEGNHIDHASYLTDKKVVPVGPLVQNTMEEFENGEIIEWLDKKEESSAVFVSFGSEYFLSKEEMEEIGYGLEQSKVCFIWAVRFPQGDKINCLEEALPEGFLNRVGERGLVVKEWAPQKRILQHPSIGGFVSHCGWSSVMESMKFGVPIVAIPMHLDQPFNAKVVEIVGVGVEVKRAENGKLEREEIGMVIKEVVVEKSGENVRKKAKEMGQSMTKNEEKDIGEVMEVLVKLCKEEDTASSEFQTL